MTFNTMTTVTSGDKAECHRNNDPRHWRAATVTTVTTPFRGCHLSPADRAPSPEGVGCAAIEQDRRSTLSHDGFQWVLPMGDGLRGSQTPIHQAIQKISNMGGLNAS